MDVPIKMEEMLQEAMYSPQEAKLHNVKAFM